MQEVDERVRWHVTAIMRILSGCVAALGTRSEITRRFRSYILATLRPVESAVRRIVIYSAMRIEVQVREGKPPQLIKPHACIRRALREKAMRQMARRSEAKGEAEERSSDAPLATPEENCAKALAPSSLTISTRHAAPRRLPAHWQDPRSPQGKGRRFSRFCLFDPPRRMPSFTESPASVLQPPRISIPGETRLLPPLQTRHLSGNDLLEAAPLKARMAAVEAALTDIPAHARRFARWWALREHELAQARREAANRQAQPLPSRAERARIRKELASSPPPPQPARRRRFHALRIGRPPGCKLKRFDPDGRLPPGSREIDEVLSAIDALAWEACEGAPA